MLKKYQKNIENKRFSKKHSIKPEKKEEKKDANKKKRKTIFPTKSGAGADSEYTKKSSKIQTKNILPAICRHGSAGNIYSNTADS